MFERAEIQTLKKRVQEPRKFIQVIMGPRQVGKTTLVRQLTKKINIPWQFESADAVPAGDSNWLDEKWELARLKIKTSGSSEFLLIFDEIQKITNWSEAIKRHWDEDSFNSIPIKLILLGSSRLLLQQGLTESLAGRFETIILTHWSFSEMHTAFDIDEERFAWFGGYPGSAELINNEDRWKNYIRDSIIETSISKDILMLTRIDKPALLKRLFEMGCLYSGQILSYTKMQGQLQDAGNTTTLAHYLNLLANSGLLGGIEKYSPEIIRKRASSPKFQVYNSALLSAQDQRTFEEIFMQPSEWGRIVESAIGAHLLNHSIKGNYNLYYWRDRNNELDFVIEKKNKVIAIEVKSNLSKNSKGISAFKEKYNPQKIIVIDNKSMPWKEFIKIDPVELF
ncbi:MAG: ATP-binding protein [Bacteroidales bacterium]